ncbi:MAG: Heme O synthase, protoheme IX farnesyltransferase [Candidatus Carbobacillus altaicus]|uniref:Protoheme IX farnesyltransferase n=1 Tax=Candidatus Carbonibacillus altaicus TaxID=2163959 RepID=A0A2R6Y4C5_9BACL|nr:MAG: Heme O synthase, protoheme IX farnesyltransferase [Candidatus Carbobacillus altaicus]
MNTVRAQSLTYQGHQIFKVRSARDLYTLMKPGIVYSNTLGALAGLFLAQGSGSFNPRSFLLYLVTLAGIALVVAGSTTLNNVIDQDIDRHMQRTKNRPVHQGFVTPVFATVYGLVLTVLGLVLLYVFAHPLAAQVAFFGSIGYVILYSLWTKRKTTFNTIVGSIAGAMPTVAGYVAYSQRFDLTAWILFLILFLWQPAHFLAIAIRREEDYARAGVPMLPVLYGVGIAKRQMVIYTLALFPVTLMLYMIGVTGPMYAIGVTILGGAYIVLALIGLGWQGEKEKRWVKWMFMYSIIYLTLFYLLIIVGAFVN